MQYATRNMSHCMSHARKKQQLKDNKTTSETYYTIVFNSLSGTTKSPKRRRRTKKMHSFKNSRLALKYF